MAKRNPEKTKNNILTAAIKDFSQFGYAGARVDRIAEESGANKRMIYHYFGNKEGLYQKVFSTLYAEIRQHEMAMDLDEKKPVEALANLGGRTFEFFVQRPEFIRILNDENLHRTHTDTDPGTPENLTATLIDRIAALLETGVSAGSIRPGLDPTQLYVSIAALGYFYISNSHTLGALFNRDLLAKNEVSARRLHIQETVRSMVQA